MLGVQLTSTPVSLKARSTSDSLKAILVRGLPLGNGYGGVQLPKAQGVDVGVALGVAVGVGVGEHAGLVIVWHTVAEVLLHASTARQHRV